MIAYLLDQGWPMGPVTLGTLRSTLLTGRLFRDHDEREDGPFAPGSSEREQAYPMLFSLIEQRLLRASLDESSPGAAQDVTRPRPRL